MESVVTLADQWVNVFQVTSSIVVAFSAMVAVLTYIRDTARQDRAAQLQVFREADESYVLLHRIMLEQRDLQVSIYNTEVNLSAIPHDQRVRSYIFFDILTSTLERVYILFQDAPAAVKQSQWPGWETYIKLVCRSPLYQEWWFREEYGYDIGFSRYLALHMEEAKSMRESAVSAKPIQEQLSQPQFIMDDMAERSRQYDLTTD